MAPLVGYWLGVMAMDIVFFCSKLAPCVEQTVFPFPVSEAKLIDDF